MVASIGRRIGVAVLLLAQAVAGSSCGPTEDAGVGAGAGADGGGDASDGALSDASGGPAVDGVSSGSDSGAGDADGGGADASAGTVTPPAGLARRVAAIAAAHPTARLRFSQRSGTLVSVVTEPPVVPETLAPLDEPLPPLQATLGTSRAAMASAVLAFLRDNAGAWAGGEDGALRYAFAPDAPETNIRLPVDAANPDPEGYDLAVDDDGLRSVRLVQTFEGRRVLDRYAIGWHDAEGNLLGLLTRLYPLPEGGTGAHVLDEAAALAAVAAADTLAAHDERLTWVAGALEEPEVEQVAEAVWEPEAPHAPDSPLIAVWQVHVRLFGRVALIRLDAASGAVRRAMDVSPSDWASDGTAATVEAVDEIGALHTIASTLHEGRYTMGVNAAWKGGAPHSPFVSPRFLAITDSQEVPSRDPAIITADPLDIPTTILDAPNTWAIDPVFAAGGAREATSLLRHLVFALDWWAAEPRSWRGWDGRGGTLWAAVNANFNDPHPVTGLRPPDVNAYGAGGGIYIGDGKDPAGKTTAYSREIVGHELLHNVVEAMVGLAYHDEPGALNEALADFYGQALTVAGNDFADDLMGNDDYSFGRDTVNPGASGRPDRYAKYVLKSGDSGGVHTNSGIVSKALGLLVRDQPAFNGVDVAHKGFLATEELVRNACRMRAFDSETDLEGFAVAVTGICHLKAALKAIALGPGHPAISGGTYEDLCRQVERAFQATDLLPGSFDADLAVVRTSLASINNSGAPNGLSVTVENAGATDPMNLAAFQVAATGEGGAAMELPSPVVWPTSLASTKTVSPGSQATFAFEFATGFLGATPLVAPVDLWFTVLPVSNPNADVDVSNNARPLRVQSDYMVGAARWKPGGAQKGYTAQLLNLTRVGTPAGLTGVYLERSTAHGPLVPVTGAPSAEVTLPADSWGGPSFPSIPLTGDGWSEPPAPILLPAATPYPAYPSWTHGRPGVIDFDSQGGLAMLEGVRQIYLLTDATDLAEESVEWNNLLCVNCVREGLRDDAEAGVLVRLAPKTDTDALFPEPYRAAARRLPPLPPVVLDEAAIAHPLVKLPLRMPPPRAPGGPVDPPTGPPTVMEISPSGGGPTTEVTLFGKNLGGTTQVWVDDKVGNTWPVAAILEVTSTTVRILMGDEPECGFVVLETPLGTAEAPWPWIPAPIITGFSPESGKKGTQVLVTGRHLCDIFEVTVGGGDAATGSTPVMYDTLGVTITSQSLTGLIAAKNGGGTGTSKGTFTVLKP